MIIEEEVYLAPGYDSYEDVVAKAGPILDATSLSKVSSCPRYHEIRLEENLRHGGQYSAKMVAGIAVHLGLDWYYAVPEDERTKDTESQAIDLMRTEWESWGIDRALMSPKETHISGEHLAKVMQNYFNYWNRQAIEIYQPISGLKVEDLDLSDVLAAKFKVNGGGKVLLAESSLVMDLSFGDGQSIVLAGKPDLPAQKQDGRLYVMDHKTTSSYLSEWWAQAHEVSNKLRGYMAMLRSLLGRELHGAVINGIYVGKYATSPTSKATKFQRFQFDFTPDHVDEALRNQWAWQETIKFYRETLGYFPQGCGFGGCSSPDICRRDPGTRDEVKLTEYIEDPRNFWDL